MSTMDQIKFGEGLFSISPVIELLKGNDASYKRLCDLWELFAYNLGLTEDETTIIFEKLTERLGRTDRHSHDIVHEVLRLWKRNHQRQASLRILFDALNESGLADLAVSVRDNFGQRPQGVSAEPAAKRSRRNTHEDSSDEADVVDSTDSDEPTSDGDPSHSEDNDDDDDDGIPPLLRAIREGQTIGRIRRILDNGANVNAMTNDTRKQNAGHEVISSLIRKTYSPNASIAILNLLMEKGFSLINDGGPKGHTPLHCAMKYEDLSEKLLTWFFENGANFNAVTNRTRSSVMFIALMHRQGVGILRKILDFGGNPKHVNRWKSNVLHIAAAHAYDLAMEIFFDTLDVNEANERNESPLHHLFFFDHLDYQHCLKILLRKGADLEAECDQGHVPLVRWMKYGKGNPFPALIRLKDRLPITLEIASKTLTVIVIEMERFKKFFPSAFQDSKNEFVQFIVFLIQEKEGKLRLKDNCQWELHNWGLLRHVILNRKFVKELRTTGGFNRIGRITAVGSTIRGTVDLHSESEDFTIPIETVLVCLLACKNYHGFLEVCQFVKVFCADL